MTVVQSNNPVCLLVSFIQLTNQSFLFTTSEGQTAKIAVFINLIETIHFFRQKNYRPICLLVMLMFWKLSEQSVSKSFLRAKIFQNAI